MTDKYEKIFKAFKEYINTNSQYSARVVKYNTNTSTNFPTITFTLSNSTNTDNCSIDKYKLDNYDEYYFTIDIYTQSKKVNNVVVASEVINNELTELTIKFFNSLNMKRTSCRPTFNIDSSVLRTTIQYQCLIGVTRNNIIRR